MKFEDMVPLIRHLTQLREAKNLAEMKMKLAVAEGGLKAAIDARAAHDRATDAWFTAWQETESAWDEVLTPLGLTRHDLRLAAL